MHIFKAALLAVALGFSVAATSCAPSTPAARADIGAETRAIEALEESWDSYWQSGDLEGLVDTYYTGDATLTATAEPQYSGRAAILENYRALKADPNLVLDYRPEDLFISASGDMAARTGAYVNTYTDRATHQPATDSGRYVVIYRKQDGAWRAAIDIETSTVP